MTGRSSQNWLGTCALIAASMTSADGAFAQQPSTDLMHASVADIQRAVAAGSLTYERLVEMYLARIAAYEKAGPKLNAIIQVNPKAIEVARALDRERREKGLRSPLHGIPVAVKDVVDVHDIPSAGGNLALAGTYPAHRRDRHSQAARGRRNHLPQDQPRRIQPRCPGA